ncbi:MAG: hypothetical protein U0800_11210 [Isosphaeraceae bacterium]
MNEEGSSIIPALVTLAGIAYFGYEVNRRRDRLRRIFSCFDKEESVTSDARRAGPERPAQAVRSATPDDPDAALPGNPALAANLPANPTSVTIGPGRIDLAVPAAFGLKADGACSPLPRRVSADRRRRLGRGRSGGGPGHRPAPGEAEGPGARPGRGAPGRRAEAGTLAAPLPAGRSVHALPQRGVEPGKSGRPGGLWSSWWHPGLEDGSLSPRRSAPALSEVAGVTGVRIGSGGLAVSYDPARIRCPSAP